MFPGRNFFAIHSNDQPRRAEFVPCFPGHDSINQNFQFTSNFDSPRGLRFSLKNPDLAFSDVALVQHSGARVEVTAEKEYLERWVSIWKLIRKTAAFAGGQIAFPGNVGATILHGTVVQRQDGAQYQVIDGKVPDSTGGATHR